MMMGFIICLCFGFGGFLFRYGLPYSLYAIVVVLNLLLFDDRMGDEAKKETILF